VYSKAETAVSSQRSAVSGQAGNEQSMKDFRKLNVWQKAHRLTLRKVKRMLTSLISKLKARN